MTGSDNLVRLHIYESWVAHGRPSRAAETAATAFRSDAHVKRWRKSLGLPRGALLSPKQQWRLADAWYTNRLAPDWRRRSPEEAEALFAELGLTGDFWRLRVV